MNKNNLATIFEDDDMGILDVPQKENPLTSDDRLISSFEEINDFIDETNRLPEPSQDVHEFLLYKRLNSIRNNDNKSKFLLPFDRHNIISKAKESEDTLEDILSQDELDILNVNDENNLFSLKNVPKEKPEYIAQREKCRDFDQFSKLFVQCHEGLKSKKLALKNFSHQHQIQEGRFFVHQGLLVYIAKIESPKDVFGRMKSRLRCIYENGTESNMFLRSLSSQLYKDGKVVFDSNNSDEPLELIKDEDISTGYIYVLKSLSDNPEISNIKNLYKIGYSSKPVEDRIRNAVNDPTYFMAPVEIVATYKCYNLNPHKFENIIHRFFNDVRLDAEIINKLGFKHSASEWFSVPIEAIDQAVNMIIEGDVIDYYYDKENESIELGNNH